MYVAYHFRQFLSSHPHLTFLGLALTDVCDHAMFTDSEDPDYRPNIQVYTDFVLMKNWAVASVPSVFFFFQIQSLCATSHLWH